MRRDTCTKVVLSGCLFLLTLISFACILSKFQPTNPQTSKAQQQPIQDTTERENAFDDPTCCGLISVGNQGVDKAWHLFTHDGRYRLAHKEDIRYPARGFGADRDSFNSIFAYCWGRLGYDTRWDHLAAIVVDTSRSDDARFGLVIFSAPTGGDGSYRPYWLYRQRDLSRTVVWTGSGDLMLAEYRDDGSRDVSFVQWDRQRKQYVISKARPKPA
jgi:hypothetical protein